mgnify:CR=1 FL=1
MSRLFVAAGAAIFASTMAVAAVDGGDHDLRGGTGTQLLAGGEICVPCHTPHNATAARASGPLWNHDRQNTAAFTPYSSTNLADTATVAGASLACLGCHDGVTGLDAWGGNTAAPNTELGGTASEDGIGTSGGNTIVGVNLSNDHPIGMTYATVQGHADRIGEFKALLATSPYLSNGKVECGSCHDPHSGTANFLRSTNAASALCLKCHNK